MRLPSGYGYGANWQKLANEKAVVFAPGQYAESCPEDQSLWCHIGCMNYKTYQFSLQPLKFVSASAEGHVTLAAREPVVFFRSFEYFERALELQDPCLASCYSTLEDPVPLSAYDMCPNKIRVKEHAQVNASCTWHGAEKEGSSKQSKRSTKKRSGRRRTGAKAKAKGKAKSSMVHKVTVKSKQKKGSASCEASDAESGGDEIPLKDVDDEKSNTGIDSESDLDDFNALLDDLFEEKKILIRVLDCEAFGPQKVCQNHVQTIS